MPIQIRLVLLSILLVLSAAIYLPGISGPYVFDDHPNLLDNEFVRITSLEPKELYHAAYSLKSGPLQRPVAMLSFALNYYFAGGFNNPTAFKLTNLAIHIINSLLVFWLARLMLTRLDWLTHRDTRQASTISIDLLAFAIALLWLVHPIELTSVLYIVQRMASLSALFTLLGLIFYFKGRLCILNGNRNGYWFILFGLLGCGALGVLSKENAGLLPFFMLIMEFTLFPEETPWASWRKLSPALKKLCITAGLVVSVLVMIWMIDYAQPTYVHRTFTMYERLLTEARVLFFYLSLIILPRIHAFGLHHDDIAISSSLLTPWTTLPAILGLAALFFLAVVLRKKRPLTSLGILWFFTGHLMESTIFSLEIAHEHRNYLASLGVIFIIVDMIKLGCDRLGHRKLWGTVPLLALFFAGTTMLRANQWSNSNKLYAFEAVHHPNSAIAQMEVGILLLEHRRFKEAGEALARAAKIEPQEPSHLMWLQLAVARHGKAPSPDIQNRILDVLASKPMTATTAKTLELVAGCLQTWCVALQVPMEEWLRSIVTKNVTYLDKSYFYFLLGITLTSQGRVTEALQSFYLSHELDPQYLHPLFSLASIYVQSGQVAKAERILAMLQEGNQNNLHPRDRDIEKVAQDIEALKKALHSKNQ